MTWFSVFLPWSTQVPLAPKMDVIQIQIVTWAARNPCQVILRTWRFLGWSSDAFTGCWWFPTKRSKDHKVTAWIRDRFFYQNSSHNSGHVMSCLDFDWDLYFWMCPRPPEQWPTRIMKFWIARFWIRSLTFTHFPLAVPGCCFASQSIVGLGSSPFIRNGQLEKDYTILSWLINHGYLRWWIFRL